MFVGVFTVKNAMKELIGRYALNISFKKKSLYPLMTNDFILDFTGRDVGQGNTKNFDADNVDFYRTDVYDIEEKSKDFLSIGSLGS